MYSNLQIMYNGNEWRWKGNTMNGSIQFIRMWEMFGYFSGTVCDIMSFIHIVTKI
jgi:hypothetical protein